MSATEGGGDPAKAWVPRGKPDQQVGAPRVGTRPSASGSFSGRRRSGSSSALKAETDHGVPTTP